jgi:E3 ubiquitin-protein ligase HUWE1
MILLRHLVESEQIITSVMEQELKAWFAQPKARNAEVSTFVKQNAAIVLREPEIFVKTTERLCCFPKYDESTSLQAIALREAAHDKSPGLFPGTKEAGATRDKPVEVIQCILYELQASRERFRIEHELDSATASSANSKKTPFRSADHPEYLYRCLLLQCLTELLASYMSCKLEFINHSRKGGKDPTTPGKPRTAVLHFLMHDLLASASINVADDLSSKKRFAIEMWTRTALVSLCSNVSDADDSNEDESLQHIRKVVLDVVIKVIKDTLSSAEIADIRYAKLISLAELLYKLMTSSASSQVPQDFRTTTPSKDLWHTAKLMIEKDFVSLLSSVLANIDLQHPSARKVLKCVLRPLKALTKISIRLSETTDLVKPIPDQGQTEGHEEESNFFEESSSESSGESDGEDREDTPDLYRNSALGLFGGDMQEESENSSYMSNEEEEMYDEMDYDDEGSETGSAVSDEELEMSDTQSAANDQGVQLIGQDQLNSYGDDLDSDEEHPDDYSDYR